MTNNTETIQTLVADLLEKGFEIRTTREFEVWLDRGNVRVVASEGDEQVTVHTFDGHPSTGLLTGTMTFRGATLALAYVTIRQLG